MGYWDLEEGKDCIEKTWITTKLGTALGGLGLLSLPFNFAHRNRAHVRHLYIPPVCRLKRLIAPVCYPATWVFFKTAVLVH